MKFEFADSTKTAILDRLDRSGPEALLNSLVSELARVGREIAAVNARLTALEHLNIVVDRIAASGEEREFAAAYPFKIRIGAAHATLGAPEFHELEFNDDGTPVRWTGPDRRFSFCFFLDRSRRAAFALEFDAAQFGEPVERISCFVDGEDIEFTVIARKTTYLATGSLPAREDKGGTVLSFICPSTNAPRDAGAADARKLGVRFRQLTVESRQDGVLEEPVSDFRDIGQWRPDVRLGSAAERQPHDTAPNRELAVLARSNVR